jgi:hypothetical protein
MEDFLKQLRKQLEDVDIEKLFKNVDLSRLDVDQLKRIDISKDKRKIRKQIEQLEHQQREEQASGEGFLSGVILGIVVGAILALIFAPRSGSETREIVSGTASDLIHKAEGLVSQGDDAAKASETSTLPDEPAIERDFGSAPATSF